MGASLALTAIFGYQTANADTYSGSQVAPEGAWCWFADPRAIHYENADKSINASYLAYIDVHGNVKATQYDFNTGKRTEVLVRSYFQPDDHNNPTFLVLPDERVLIIYSRHTDEPAFYYRVSKRPGDISDLGDEKKIVTASNTTYPSPFILSDDLEHFYLCWRGIGWHPTIAKLTLPDANDDVKVEWGPFQMVQSTGARPYAKYYSNGKDKIYFTYTTGHPDNEQTNWLYCNVININAQTKNGKVTTNPTLEDITGKTLSTIANGKFNVNKTDDYKNAYPMTVVDATPNIRDWVWQITLDEKGNPVIPMVKISGDKNTHVYYLAKWTGEKWNVTQLANGGGRFHSSNTEYCYSGGEAVDPENPNVLYLSIPTNGDYGKVYEIWKYTVDNEGKVTDKEQITRNSVKNNVRPYVLNNHGDSPITVAWMNGDYYYWMVQKNYPAGYPTSIQCNYDYVPEIGEMNPEVMMIGKDVAATDATKVTLPAGAFTLSVDMALDENAYGGTILEADGFKYEVAASNQIPSLTVAGVKSASSNRLLTSDNWATNSGGTSGDNWPTKHGNINFTFVYDGSNLTVYRNHVIDQIVPAANLNTANLKIGGFKGRLNDIVVFGRALNQDEVKAYHIQKSFSALNIPERIHTDLVLPDKVGTSPLTWTSSHEEIIKSDGTFRSPAQETEIVLTAATVSAKRDFTITAHPRDIMNNLVASYDFDPSECEVRDGKTYVKDLSGHGHDVRLEGSAKADGTLNLTANKSGGFSTNGYAVVSPEAVNDLRSYTVMFDTKLSSTAGAPRFYDFGFNSGNSFFCRAATLVAGIKYQGGNTTMTNASQQLSANKDYEVAVTFDARTKTTKIYLDGTQVASGTENVNEPYMLSSKASCERNYIGRTQWWDSNVANDNQDMIGTMDNFKLFNTCLSADEIKLAKNLTTVSNAIYEELPGHHDLYDIHGRLIRKNADSNDIKNAAPGIYIMGGKKIVR